MFGEKDVNAVDEYLHESALIKAVFDHKPEVVDELLAQTNIDLHIQGYLTGTALTYAIFSGQDAVAKKLLAQENVFRNQDHPGAVNCAVMREAQEMLALLVAKGANINTPGYEGVQEVPDDVWQMNPDADTYPAACAGIFTTPLCCAVERESLVMVTSLLETHHADPNVVTARKETALILAARQGNEGIFNFLMTNGADLQQVIDGRTVESIIREDHLIRHEIKALLAPQTTTAHDITSYQGSFIPGMGRPEGLKVNLESVQGYLQAFIGGGQSQRTIPPEVEGIMVTVTALLLQALPVDKRTECIKGAGIQQESHLGLSGPNSR